MTPSQQPEREKHPMRCVIVTSCKECPWRTCTTIPGIEDNPDGTPKRLIWCLGKDNSRIDLKEEDLYTIHHDCPLPITNCSHSDMAHHDEQVRREERMRVLKEIMDWITSCEGGDVVFNLEMGLFSGPSNFNTVGLIHKLLSLRQSSSKKEGE